jgi:hypothetical protein
MTDRSARTLISLALILAAPLILGGCLARAAVGIVAETVEAGVEITGAAAGAVVDVATPGGGKDDDDKDDKN